MRRFTSYLLVLLAGVLLMGCFESSDDKKENKVSEPKNIANQAPVVKNDNIKRLEFDEIFPPFEGRGDLKLLVSAYKYEVSAQNREKFLAALPSHFENKNGTKKYQYKSEGVNAIASITGSGGEYIELSISAEYKAIQPHTTAYLAQVFGSKVVGDIKERKIGKIYDIPSQDEPAIKELLLKYGESIKNRGFKCFMDVSTGGTCSKRVESGSDHIEYIWGGGGYAATSKEISSYTMVWDF
jgi:hypothetical protein